LVETQTSSSPRRLGWRTALPSGCRPHHRRALRHCRHPLHIRGHHDRRSCRLPRCPRRVLASAMRYASECGSIHYFACTQRVMFLFAFSCSRELQNLYGLFLRRGGMHAAHAVVVGDAACPTANHVTTFTFCYPCVAPHSSCSLPCRYCVWVLTGPFRTAPRILKMTAPRLVFM